MKSFYFSKLLDNLYRNARRFWVDDQGSKKLQNISITARAENGSAMVLEYGNEGREVPAEMLPKLFRVPVSSRMGDVKNGLGLWAVGMALNSNGIPYPRVRNVKGTGPLFIFEFPIHRQD